MSNGQKQRAKVTEEEFDFSNLSTQLSKVVDCNAKLLEELKREQWLLLESRKNREIAEKEFLELKLRLTSTWNGIVEQDRIHSRILRRSGILECLQEISDGLGDIPSPDTTSNLLNCEENSKLPDIGSSPRVLTPSNPTIKGNPAWEIFSGTDISSTVARLCLRKRIAQPVVHSPQRSRPHCPRKSKR